jgi:hypothetical protein
MELILNKQDSFNCSIHFLTSRNHGIQMSFVKRIYSILFATKKRFNHIIGHTGPDIFVIF